MRKESAARQPTRRNWNWGTVLLVSLLAIVLTVSGSGCGKSAQDKAIDKPGDKPGENAGENAVDTAAGTAMEEVTILCGSSFLGPSEELTKAFTAETGIAVAITAAGSEDFLPLIKAGQKGDILITHDPYLDFVRDANALADSVQVGVVAPVVAVQKGNPKGLAKFDDLARPGLRVALSNPEYSTCGEMIFQLLDKKGLKDAVLQNVENRLTKGHGTLGTLLKTGAVDVVIMWNGVAHTFGDSVQIVPTPYEYDTEVRVHVIGLSYAEHSAAMRRFVDFCKTKGPEVFAAHGYTKDAK